MSEDLATGAGAAREPRAPRARQLPVIMDDTIAARLGVLGRTEDVAVSPDGRRLAIACFGPSRIALVDFTIERDHDGDRPSAALVTSAVMVDCLGLSMPHGLAFIDDRRIVTANRGAELLLVDIPPVGHDAACVTVQGRLVANAGSPVPVKSPGSVAAIDAGSGLAELLVCDNDGSTLTRFVLDTYDGCAVLDSEILLRKRLNIPDSVTLSPSGEWLAISNHWSNEVFVYRYDDRLGPDDEPHGVLEGPNFPHGLRFSSDSRHIVVADSGLPYVHTYESERGDWSGRRQPVSSVRVMDDDEYLAGKYNFQEGGPKGLEFVDGDRAVVLTSEFQPLAFFDTAELGWQRSTAPSQDRARTATVAGRVIRRAKAETVAARTEVDRLREHAGRQSGVVEAQERTIAELRGQLAELEAHAADGRAVVEGLRVELHRLTAETTTQRDELDRLRAEVEQLTSSTSWRLTAPLRKVADRAKRR